MMNKKIVLLALLFLLSLFFAITIFISNYPSSIYHNIIGLSGNPEKTHVQGQVKVIAEGMLDEVEETRERVHDETEQSSSSKERRRTKTSSDSVLQDSNSSDSMQTATQQLANTNTTALLEITPNVQQDQNPNFSNISIAGSGFFPSEMTVKAGTIVVWTNEDNNFHSVKSSSFQSVPLNKSEIFMFKFNLPGSYDYYCGIHPEIKGKIIVVE